MGIEIPGWAGQLVIALPYVLLALVALAFLRRRGEPSRARLPGDIGRDGVPAARQPGWDGAAGDGPARAPVVPPPLPVPPQPQGVQTAAAARPEAATPPAVPAPPAAVEAKPQPAREPSLAEIEASLERAEVAGRDNDVALLSLYLARRRKAAGQADYVEGIRRCIRLAAQLGLKELHGEARLDLGDEARAAGDLTTACEHWQIARALFEEAKLAAKRDSAEARMKRFGCPTDWVLNDF